MNAPRTDRSPAHRPVALPDWLDPQEWLAVARHATARDVEGALGRDAPGIADFAALVSPAADAYLEGMAQKAQVLTRRHFGRTVQLYVPLYLADYCSAGCVYCGFSSDRDKPRRKLDESELIHELSALRDMGFDEVLLLTGDRTGEAGFDYLRRSIATAATLFSHVSVETFTMTREEYHRVAEAGCTSVALYQETYDTAAYFPLHRWGPKFHYEKRLLGPEQALSGDIRSVGLGVLLGIADPVYDLLSLFRHATHLQRRFWRGGVSVSFPRIRPQLGGYEAQHPVDERFLARIIFAFRICMPEVPLTLSTRESAAFRDGMAGLGVNRMSVASRTTVGGYYDESADRAGGQFDISDERDVATFCAMLRAKGLEPVFKNWDAVYREAPAVAAH
jgi:2-iminoacetate synthase